MGIFRDILNIIKEFIFGISAEGNSICDGHEYLGDSYVGLWNYKRNSEGKYLDADDKETEDKNKASKEFYICDVKEYAPENKMKPTKAEVLNTSVFKINDAAINVGGKSSYLGNDAFVVEVGNRLDIVKKIDGQNIVKSCDNLYPLGDDKLFVSSSNSAVSKVIDLKTFSEIEVENITDIPGVKDESTDYMMQIVNYEDKCSKVELKNSKEIYTNIENIDEKYFLSPVFLFSLKTRYTKQIEKLREQALKMSSDNIDKVLEDEKYKGMAEDTKNKLKEDALKKNAKVIDEKIKDITDNVADVIDEKIKEAKKQQLIKEKETNKAKKEKEREDKKKEKEAKKDIKDATRQNKKALKDALDETINDIDFGNEKKRKKVKSLSDGESISKQNNKKKSKNNKQEIKTVNGFGNNSENEQVSKDEQKPVGESNVTNDDVNVVDNVVENMDKIINEVNEESQNRSKNIEININTLHGDLNL